MLPLLKVPVSDRFADGNRALVSGFVCLLAFLLSATEVFAGDFSSENRNRYRDKFLQIAKDLKIPESEISFSFRVPGVGRISHREDTLRIPASTMKLVVTAAAWELLGPDFEMKTDLLIDGPVSNGVLEGNLIVVGRGDPAVVGREDEEDVLWELRPWCEQLKRLGVAEVKGKVLADIRYFSGPGFHPDWPRQSAHQWYYAASGALNLNDNCLDLFLGPVSEGEIGFSVRPLQPLAKFSNRLKIIKDSKKHLIRIDRKFDEWSVVISGAFFQGAQKQKFHVTVPDPAENFVSAFTNLLSTEGVSVSGESIDLGSNTLSGVVVVSLALPPRDLVKTLISEHFDLTHGFGWGQQVAYLQPGLSRIVQAAGRIIRGPKDKGVLCLVDPRFADPKLAGFFPEHWQVQQSSTKEVENHLNRFWSNDLSNAGD